MVEHVENQHAQPHVRGVIGRATKRILPRPCHVRNASSLPKFELDLTRPCDVDMEDGARWPACSACGHVMGGCT